MISWVSDALRRLDAAVMPNACVFCGQHLDVRAAPICTGCYEELPRTAGPVPVHGLMTYAPLRYEFPVDAAIKALKFARKLWYAPALAAVMAEEVENLPKDVDAVLPVPLHWRRQSLRGFNQAAELLRPLRGRLQLAEIRKLRRRRNTAPQSGLDAAGRRRNTRGAFIVRGVLHASHVLLIDDVLTTGTTCAAVADALGRAGVTTVSVLVAARAQPK